MSARWGLLDTQDDVWLGDEYGPRTFEQHDLARMAALVLAECLGWPLNRVRAAEYAEQVTTKRDSVSMRRSPTTAIRRLERAP